MGTRKQKQLKKQAVITLDDLSEERLKVALDFLEYLKEKEEWEATGEILADPEAIEAIQAVKEDWKAGRMDRFISLEEVKQRVQGRAKPASRQDP